MALGGETLTTLGPVPITNTLLATLLVDTVLLGSAFALRSKLALIPGKFQSFMEMIYEFLRNMVSSALPKKYVELYFPWIATIFLFIVIGNWMGLLPGFETITLKVPHGGEMEAVHLLKGANSDLNTTGALALITFFLVQGTALWFLGIKNWIGHYFHLKPIQLAAIFIFVGILELILEPMRYITLMFRLFGNVFAGEVLVHAMSQTPGVAIPFLVLEVLVGVIQAMVFCSLTLVFLSLMLKEDDHSASSEAH